MFPKASTHSTENALITKHITPMSMSTAPMLADIMFIFARHVSLPSFTNFLTIRFCSIAFFISFISLLPPKIKLSREIWKVCAIKINISISGRLRLFSQFDTACLVTFSFSANYSCVKPSWLRKDLICSPKFISNLRSSQLSY